MMASSSSSVTEQTRKQANLRLLQRTCSKDIVDILQTATHVVLYEFVGNAWQKSGVEGSLFLVQTLTVYELVILNRNSNQNFQMSLQNGIQMQQQDPYLIFRQKIVQQQQQQQQQIIRGIWFHNAKERIAMAQVLQQVLSQPSPPPPPRETATAAPTGSNNTTPSPGSAQALASLLVAPMAAASINNETASSAALPSTLSSSSSSPLLSTSSPSAAAAAAAATTTPGAAGGVALDKKSLQLALLSLIQDDRFLDLLHSQYLRVVHARAKKKQQQQQPNNNNNG